MYSLQNGTLETLLDLHDKVQINSILCQTPNRIWVATEGNGLYLYDVKNKKLDNYRYENKLSCLNSNYVRSLALDPGEPFVGRDLQRAEYISGREGTLYIG